MSKINNPAGPRVHFDYSERQNAPGMDGQISGIMYEKKIQKPDGTVTIKLKNFSLNSAGFHTKALLSGYTPLRGETAKAYMESRGLTGENLETVFQNLSSSKYFSASAFKSTIDAASQTQRANELSRIDAIIKDILS